MQSDNLEALVLVPLKLTQGMAEAYWRSVEQSGSLIQHGSHELAQQRWEAMIKAAGATVETVSPINKAMEQDSQEVPGEQDKPRWVCVSLGDFHIGEKPEDEPENGVVWENIENAVIRLREELRVIEKENSNDK